MSKAFYLQPGDVIDYVNSTAAVIANGDVVKLGTRIGVAMGDILPGALGALKVTGVFTFPASASLTAGAAVYWDGTEITATAAGNTPAGWVVSARSGFADVKIGG